MANTKVEKAILDALNKSEGGQIEAGSTADLKRQIGLPTIKAQCLLEALTNLKRQHNVRCFSTTAPHAYIRAAA